MIKINNSLPTVSIGSVFIEAIEECDARCLACDYWTKRAPRRLDKRILKSILPWLFRHGVDHINWTGGEPTLHPDLAEMFADSWNSNIRNLLITNAGSLDDIYSEIGKYIYKVIISADACSKEQYKSIRGVDRFDKVIEAPSLIKKHNQDTKVTLCMVLQKKNIESILDFIDMAFDLPIDKISFVVPDVWGFIRPEDRGCSFGHTKKYTNNRIGLIAPSIEQLEAFKVSIPEIQRKILSNRPELANSSLKHLHSYYEYFCQFDSRESRPRKSPCLIPFQTAVITVDGHIKPCFYINESVKIDCITNPINSFRMKLMRRKLTQNADYKARYCDYCMQTGET